MSGKSVETQYGGIQFAMVDGLKDGAGVARIGVFGVKAGQVISNEEIVSSNLGRDLEKPTVTANGQFVLCTRQVDYGFAAPSHNPGLAVETPVAKIVSEKQIVGVQGAPRPSAQVDAKVVSEKEVRPAQSPVGGGSSVPLPKA